MWLCSFFKDVLRGKEGPRARWQSCVAGLSPTPQSASRAVKLHGHLPPPPPFYFDSRGGVSNEPP